MCCSPWAYAGYRFYKLKGGILVECAVVIDTLLDQVGGFLEDYTDTPLEELSKDEASDIIDELKGELGYD